MEASPPEWKGGFRPRSSLGNGPLPNDGVDRTPTERYLYRSRSSYSVDGWSRKFHASDGRVRYMERKALGPMATNSNTFLGLPCDHKDRWHIGEYHWTGPSPTRSKPCGQKVPYYLNGYSCSSNWLLKNLMTLTYPIRENIYRLTITKLPSTGYSHLYWLTTDDQLVHPLMYAGSGAAAVSPEYESIPTLENMVSSIRCYVEGEFCWIRGFAEALRRRRHNGSQEAKEVLIDFLGFISMRIKSLTWLKRNKLFHPCIKHISIDFDSLDEFNVPFTDDFVSLCSYISSNLPNLESVILWLRITEDDFQSVLRSPLSFSWVRSFRALPVRKVDICPMLTSYQLSTRTRIFRLKGCVGARLGYFWKEHSEADGERSLLVDDVNKERGLIQHILTPGSKLWGYIDDIDDETYISLQYMEGWNSYTDDIADDAYISLQYMERWNDDQHENHLAAPLDVSKRARQLLNHLEEILLVVFFQVVAGED
ncbi:hypothetical protein SBOR_3418 [Sclerotinia borealis F-4128]|uniref:Uncharacterized protein n=1 Tax=Sclerotinia borealis (strain F-4128) TaxID=1432307 RepID=W9CHG1_SCLBF|nr:hypothetical protein SBOR_3418 [Sclerotinia borealis F-4128]